MISEIANKILSLHLEYKESFDRVSQNVSKEKKVKELHEKIFLLE